MTPQEHRLTGKAERSATRLLKEKLTTHEEQIELKTIREALDELSKITEVRINTTTNPVELVKTAKRRKAIKQAYNELDTLEMGIAMNSAKNKPSKHCEFTLHNN